MINGFAVKGIILMPFHIDNQSTRGRNPTLDALRDFPWWLSKMPRPLSNISSAFIACTGPFMGPKPVHRDAHIDLRSAPTWLWDHQTEPTPTLDALEGLPMMTIEDAAPFVTHIQCIHRMHWSIYGAKASAPRRPHRPQISPYMALGPSNGANTHARCFEGLPMMTIEDAAPFVTHIQCIHCMHWSIYGAKASAPRRPHRPRLFEFTQFGLWMNLVLFDGFGVCILKFLNWIDIISFRCFIFL